MIYKFDKRCWNEDPLIRPNASEIKNIIKNWYKNISNKSIFSKNNSRKAINDIIEFYKADKFLKDRPNILYTSQSHSQAYHTSHLLDFTIKLNEILNQESKNNQATEVSESIGNYLIF